MEEVDASLGVEACDRGLVQEFQHLDVASCRRGVETTLLVPVGDQLP